MHDKTLKIILAGALAASVASAPARANDLGAAIVGGIVGGAIVNSVNKNKQRSAPRKTTSSTKYSYQRQQNREMQTALNYFGFSAGVPDGVVGGNTRRAVSQYQVYMGYPATGTLTQYERDFLVASHNRAQIGGPEVIKAMQNTAGVTGLLLVWRDEAAGIRSGSVTGTYAGVPQEVGQAIDEVAESSDPSAEQLLQRSGFLLLADLNSDGKNDYIIDTSVSGSSFWCGASHCTAMVFVSTPQGYVRSDFLARGVTAASFSCHQSVCRLVDEAQTQLAAATPETKAPVATQPAAPVTTLASTDSTQPSAALPSFSFGQEETPKASLASFCSKVSLLTNTNGGYITLASMTDPDLVLGEQFCLTRSYAIGVGETMVSSVQGATPEQIDAQCDGFGPALAPYISQLTASPSQNVVAEVQKFALQTNMSLEQLANTARICLFSGYRRDELEVALGLRRLLTSIGQAPFAELVGHHLSQGYGIAQSADRAKDWYNMAVSSLDSGAEPVFAPGQPERVALLKAAANGLGAADTTPQPAASSASTLPTFKLD